MTPSTTLGCVGCPCAQSCGGHQPAALGCTRPSGLGFTLPDFSSIDLTDPKTLIIAGLIVTLIYNLFCRGDQRAARADRSRRIRAARERYRGEMKRIQGAEA
jgi:hypothetical protein